MERQPQLLPVGFTDLSAAVCVANEGAQGFHDRHSFYRDESSNPGTPRHDDQPLPGTSSILGTASAAAALADLKRESDMEVSDQCRGMHASHVPRGGFYR